MEIPEAIQEYESVFVMCLRLLFSHLIGTFHLTFSLEFGIFCSFFRYTNSVQVPGYHVAMLEAILKIEKGKEEYQWHSIQK